MITVSAVLQSVGYPTIAETVVENKGRFVSKEGENDLSPAMHSRRIDDHIRELCARLVASTEHHDVVLRELKAALHQSIQRLRIRAAASIHGCRDFPERRKIA